METAESKEDRRDACPTEEEASKMAVWKCLSCGATKEGRCKPRKCQECGSDKGFEKVEEKK